MRDIKLINILKTFSKEEMKLFGKFVASPFHNSGKNCMPLFKLLGKSHPDFKSGDFTYENIHEKLYPGRKFNKQVAWNLTSAMETMAKEFLKQLALRKNKFTAMELALSEFSSRKLVNNYSQTMGEMEKFLEAGGIDYEYFDKKVHLENYKNDYCFLIDKHQLKGEPTLKSCEYQIMLFLRNTVGGLRDMKILEEFHNYRYDVNIPYEFAKNLKLENIVVYANKNNFEYAYLIEIYYHSLMMLLEPRKIQHMYKFRELYETHYRKLAKGEQGNMMHWLINYCLYNIELDESKLRRIVFELNIFRLNEGLAFYPGELFSKVIYLQILNSALDVNETEWALNFIKDYTSKLLPEIQDSMRCMAYAFLYFHTKDYRKVIENLNQVEFIDIRDKLQTRVVSAKSYYELDETETVLNIVDSSKHFLINNPLVSETVRIYVHNFFKYLQKLVLIKEGKESVELGILKKDIDKVKEISGKQWLLEKITELENKK
ncbi:MAG: hypothetical protein ABI543_05465 [Ignavibacteria bacterium]